MFKKFFRRGQVAVLYALLIPVFLVMGGVGLDLGWYYFNVYRLQNAADAAALAGANNLVGTGDENTTRIMRDYFVDGLVRMPGDIVDENKYKLFNVETDEGVIAKEVEVKEAKAEAQLYAVKNLNPDGVKAQAQIDGINKQATSYVTNAYTSAREKANNVTFSALLYTRILDRDREVNSNIESIGYRYYKVELREQVKHFFLGNFDDMDAHVVAWAVIKPRDIDLVTIANELEKTQIISNVLKQKDDNEYQGNWEHYQDAGTYYTAGDAVRKEIVNVSENGDRKNNYDKNKTTNASNVDSLNLDFRVEYAFDSNTTIRNTIKAGKNWDLRSSDWTGITAGGGLNNGWNTDYKATLRLHTSFNFNQAWEDRNKDDGQADILWTRIESDPIWFEYGSNWNSVHQIFLNAHEDNTATEKLNGTDKEYFTQRPFFIFYNGPEYYGSDPGDRVSQPVVLNLYNDWNACIYMPNSPVIINGNGYKLTGFVIAKEYRRATKAEEIIAKGYSKYEDGYGNKVFIKNSDLLTQADVNKVINDNEYTIDTDSNGYIKCYGKVEADKYLIIETQYIMETSTTNSTYYKNYKNTLLTYKKDSNGKSITDSDIVDITFPTTDTLGATNNNKTYPVYKGDLVDSLPSNNSSLAYDKQYVEILLSDGTAKYIAKTNLPYAKVYRYLKGDWYSFVPVSDIKAKNSSDNKFAGVTLLDVDTNTKISDKDAWFVHRDSMNDIYQPSYNTNKKMVTKYTGADGCYYFVFTDEIKTEPQLLAQYRKIIDSNGNVYYVKESDTESFYYMEITPEGASGGKDADGKAFENKVIVDNLGDLQSEPITPQAVLDVETVSQNEAVMSSSDLTVTKYLNDYTRATNGTSGSDRLNNTPKEQPGDPGIEDDGKYRGTSQGRQTKDYKIPSSERVYYADKCFNLSTDSRYSYFDYEELRRVNYLYLNTDGLNGTKIEDMFFTTKRAEWID